MLARLGNAVPEPAELGYHLCYGTPNDEHVVMPEISPTRSRSPRRAAGLRVLQFLHVPAPKHRTMRPITRRSTGFACPRRASSISG